MEELDTDTHAATGASEPVCDVPPYPDPDAVTKELGAIASVKVKGTTYTLTLVAPLVQCAHAELVVTTDPPLPAGDVINTDTLPVGVRVFMFSLRGDEEGKGWSPRNGRSNCMRHSKRLPLRQRWGDDGGPSSLLARLVPDTSSKFYMFALEVRPDLALACVYRCCTRWRLHVAGNRPAGRRCKWCMCGERHVPAEAACGAVRLALAARIS